MNGLFVVALIAAVGCVSVIVAVFKPMLRRSNWKLCFSRNIVVVGGRSAGKSLFATWCVIDEFTTQSPGAAVVRVAPQLEGPGVLGEVCQRLVAENKPALVVIDALSPETDISPLVGLTGSPVHFCVVVPAVDGVVSVATPLLANSALCVLTGVTSVPGYDIGAVPLRVGEVLICTPSGRDLVGWLPGA